MEKILAEAFKSESRVLVNEGYIEAATSDNTRMAYQSDINHFEKFGGDLPTHPNAIEQYLKESAPNYNPRTLKRRYKKCGDRWHADATYIKVEGRWCYLYSVTAANQPSSHIF